jgi:hypothetical protein
LKVNDTYRLQFIKISKQRKIAARVLNTKDLAIKNLQKVTIAEATYKQMRRTPPEYNQNDAQNI